MHEIRAKIELIPPEEREKIAFLFRHLMFDFSYAYVLFGDKPMSFHDLIRSDTVSKEFMHSYSSFSLALKNCKLQRGWAAWVQYRHLFPLKKYIFVQQEYYSALSGKTTVFFVNKKKCLKMMEKYSKDFREVLGSDFHPHEIIASFSKRHIALDEKLKRHPALLGILLGYGRENAWRYYQIGKLRHQASKDPSAAENLADAQAQFVPFSDAPNPDFGSPIQLPMFLCEPKSKETLGLKKKYLKQHAEIGSAYQNGDFLEVTLLKLTEE